MKEGPDIALLGTMIGDPARANMLIALMSGKALTASELANEAGIMPQTASSHLAKLEQAFMVKATKQGRHKYFTLKNNDVAHLLETMMGLAAQNGQLRTRTGPKDPALRHARACYSHLAGELAVFAYDQLIEKKYMEASENDEEAYLTAAGKDFFEAFGLNPASLQKPSKPLCKPCLDWSARRHHLAGDLGGALLDKILDLKWASREPSSRIIKFTKVGEQQFKDLFVKG
ncbi:ArsR/SmtB family transcription factor [Curvivirga aplysinae]|uniref:ArsR/SmtB family transcription factor n=1 Tax=Curvivirga aplysinae TaxID=2529852 RepID=UPI0012BB87F6|nr:winged helix-turn-helix domain-containing protein [Curvivirga aplysinae]MTI09453.1 ArsR family transcriptional regulator [Curvivirga aplysinae]